MLFVEQTFLANVYGNDVKNQTIYALCEQLEQEIKSTPALNDLLINRQAFYADVINLANQYYGEALYPSDEFLTDSINHFVYYFEDIGVLSWEDALPSELSWLNIQQVENNIPNYTKTKECSTIEYIENSLIDYFQYNNILNEKEKTKIKTVATELYQRLLPIFEKLAEKKMRVRISYTTTAVASDIDLLFKALMGDLTGDCDSLVERLILCDNQEKDRALDDLAFFFEQCLHLNNSDSLPIYELTDFCIGVCGTSNGESFELALQVGLSSILDMPAYKDISTVIFSTVVNSFYHASR